MKKKLVIMIPLLLILVSYKNVYALDNTENENLIENKINEFLIDNDIDNIYDLSKSKEEELVNEIQDYKVSLGIYQIQPRWFNPWEYATTYDIKGMIFVSLDSHSSGWNYGHAGIGHSAGGNVIEANPGDGVKLYTDRVNSYWSSRSSGGVYSVSGASSSDYTTAKNYAVARIGRGYSFNPLDNNFYCSELVYYAWDSAGYNIASSRVWGQLILPSQIMNDGDTVLMASFPF